MALRLPQHLAADLHVAEGTTVSLSVEDHTLVVRPARKRYRLADLLAAHQKDANHGEADWGKLAGQEEW